MRPSIPLENLVSRCVRTTRGWRIGELAAVVGVSLTALLESKPGELSSRKSV
jgi:hypothetical protein